MGARGSKQIQRKFPQHASEVKSSAAETHAKIQKQNTVDDAVISSHNIIASATRNKVIEEDGKDPHLLSNLQEIGQVTLPKVSIPFKQSDGILEILKHRQIELKENENVLQKNRISVNQLNEMLEKRNLDPNEWTPEKLASQYNLDVPTIKVLLKHINTFTIKARIVEQVKESPVKTDIVAITIKVFSAPKFPLGDSDVWEGIIVISEKIVVISEIISEKIVVISEETVVISEETVVVGVTK
ncbi:15436_t:CDS:2 [Cetraspora pellucida]|uniref:15436_t:CDS:1 n=1 Tax=Cetraspora pellucida TaxID=1433469 RepID=A0A9N9F1C5_9GLOM|nr:15436_t:CDS:2 [Cetraspora pellucida]